MVRFTLERGHWYACEIIGDEIDADRCSYTPIKVFAVMPGNTGKRQFELDFHHAKYPARVQHKRYRLRTIERGERYLLTHAGNIKFGIKGVVARSFHSIHDVGYQIAPAQSGPAGRPAVVGATTGFTVPVECWK